MLPIGEVLADVVESLERSANLVLEAPPGAGKTTLVPLALLSSSKWLDGGRIVMLEPRRLASKAAARRMASMLGESVGQTVGYTIRGESAVSAATRIEVCTSGVLLRRLQRDASLPGVAALLLDEVHERGVDTDAVLALAAHAQSLLRPDLRVLAMSATLGGSLAADCSRVLRGAPVVSSAGRSWPVRIEHLPEPGKGRGDLEEATAAAVRKALDESPGCVLVFLPGAHEIRRVARLLSSCPVPVLPLYGDLPAAAQEAALAAPPPGGRRVVLATSIAESSLTVAGVRVVVDSGLSRASAFNPNVGFSRLVTRKTSAASAEQRAGRAGRVAPGVAYRLYSAASGASRQPQATPEILACDLAPLALELAIWGASPGELAWLDPPPQGGLAAASALLVSLGCLSPDGRPTDHGRACATLGTHPRLAHMLLRARDAGCVTSACLLAAVLEERDPLRRGETPAVGGPGADVRLRMDAASGALRPGSPSLAGFAVDPSVVQRINDNARLLRAQIDDATRGSAPSSTALLPAGDDTAFLVGLLLACAYPDRVATARDAGTYLLANGKTASFADARLEPLAAHNWVVAADVDGDTTRPRIFAAAPLPPDCVHHPWVACLVSDETRVFWSPKTSGATARRVRSVGAIVLSEAVLPTPTGDALAAALCVGIREHLGLSSLPWTKALRSFRARAQFLVQFAPSAVSTAGLETLPALDDAALLSSLEIWLAPFIPAGVSSKAGLASVDLDAALRSLFSPPQLRFIDAAAPIHFLVPSGSKLPIDYEQAHHNGGTRLLSLLAIRVFGEAESSVSQACPYSRFVCRKCFPSSQAPALQACRCASSFSRLRAGRWRARRICHRSGHRHPAMRQCARTCVGNTQNMCGRCLRMCWTQRRPQSENHALSIEIHDNSSKTCLIEYGKACPSTRTDNHHCSCGAPINSSVFVTQYVNRNSDGLVSISKFPSHNMRNFQPERPRRLQ